MTFFRKRRRGTRKVIMGGGLRVLFYADSSGYDDPYGIGTVVRSLAQGLGESGCEVRTFPHDPLEGLRLVGGWADILHAHVGLGFRDLTLARFLFARPLPLVQTVHGLPLRSWGNPGFTAPDRIAAFLFDLRGTISARTADRVIVNSRYMERAVRDLCGVRAGRIAVIPNGVDVDFLRADGRSLGWPEGPHVLFLGRHHPLKGADVLLHAFRSLNIRWPGAKLHLLSSGVATQELRRLSTDMGLDGRVQFHGYVSREDLPRYLRAADVAAFPSRYEPYGIAILEAMASSVPVVATRVGGIPELVQDGVNGLLVKPGEPVELAEAMGRILEDRELARRLGEAGRATAAQLPWEKACRATLEEYGLALDQDPRHRRR